MTSSNNNTCTNSKETLHVAFCVNDGYVPYLCVALKSIAHNHKSNFTIIVHILTDFISDKSNAEIRHALQDNNNISYIIHNVDDTPFNGLAVSHYTIYTWYRLLLPDLLPDVNRILYLDTDIVVNSGLDDMLCFDLEGKAIATPMDTDTFLDEPFERCGYNKDLHYVCVGVMLINLAYWRANDISQKAIDWGRKHKDIVKYPDQDSINYVCRESKTFIPLKYGVTKSLFTQKWFYTPQYICQLSEAFEAPAIIHYAGCAPWYMESDHPMVDVWSKYNHMIERPVKRVYATKGFLGFKLRLWDILHPNSSRAAITYDEIRRRIENVK